MTPSQTKSTNWSQVLTRVECALNGAVARLDDRAQALAAAAALPQSSKTFDFSKFDRRFAAFREGPRQVEQLHDALDVALRDGEDALRRWLIRAETVRRQLATLVG